jgi:Holliday junction resolvase RusA-like endonuclease
MKFFVPMTPIGKGRPRVTRGGMHTYTPAKTVAAEKLIALSAQAAGVRPIDGPVILEVDAEFLYPKSWSKKRIAESIASGRWHTVTPDCDNVGKLCADSLNGIAYKDDSQVCQLTVRKYYSFSMREGLNIRIASV